MLDVFFVVITILFFVIATLYLYGCDLLRPRSARPGRPREVEPR